MAGWAPVHQVLKYASSHDIFGTPPFEKFVQQILEAWQFAGRFFYFIIIAQHAKAFMVIPPAHGIMVSFVHLLFRVRIVEETSRVGNSRR